MKKILFITLAAIGLSFLASSCVKESDSDSRVKEIVAAKLDSLNKQVAALEKTQAALNDSLKNIKGDVEKLSKRSKSLTDSISAVKNSLAAQKRWTEAELKTISGRVNDIETAQAKFMTEVYDRLGRLESRIQKISVVPDYHDGRVMLGELDSVLTFVVCPAYVADSIVKEKGKSVFTLVATRTLTKAATFDTLVIKSVSSEDGVVSVEVDLKKLPEGYDDADVYNASLKIQDGNSENMSGFFPLHYRKYIDLGHGFDSIANCYIVSKPGDYKFIPTHGNWAKVDDIKSVKVLWESFGTSEDIEEGALVGDVNLLSGDNIYITFTATERKGNAVIAAYDGEGTSGYILWSWHIWLTDEPAEQTYNNGAGIMMDRNLGATCAKPTTRKDSVAALGLLYQWGRKDPFLGADATSDESGYPQQAASTLTDWLTVDAYQTGESRDNRNYSIIHPTTFISKDQAPHDWYMADNTGVANDSLWRHPDGTKTAYDPCPAGWRVPYGGSKNGADGGGVWAKAFGTDETFKEPSFKKGLDFTKTGKKLMDSGECWYPAAGCRDRDNGRLSAVGSAGNYWSCTKESDGHGACYFDLGIINNNEVRPAGALPGRAGALSVRCLKGK